MMSATRQNRQRRALKVVKIIKIELGTGKSSKVSDLAFRATFIRSS